MKTQTQPELLAEIPSPSARMWVGLCIILSIFVVFAAYTIHEIRWLEDYQVNVVQRNRKASLELLRLQSNAYLLAISLRDMTAARARYPIHEWRPEFMRIGRAMDDAVRLEGEFPGSTPPGQDK